MALSLSLSSSPDLAGGRKAPGGCRAFGRKAMLKAFGCRAFGRKAMLKASDVEYLNLKFGCRALGRKAVLKASDVESLHTGRKAATGRKATTAGRKATAHTVRIDDRTRTLMVFCKDGMLADFFPCVFPSFFVIDAFPVFFLQVSKDVMHDPDFFYFLIILRPKLIIVAMPHFSYKTQCTILIL